MVKNQTNRITLPNGAVVNQKGSTVVPNAKVKKKEKKTRKAVKDDYKLQVWEYLKTLDTAEHTLQEITDAMNQKFAGMLGFDMETHTIRNYIKVCKLPPPKGSRNKLKADNDRNAIIVIARCLRDLFHHSGREVPSELEKVVLMNPRVEIVEEEEVVEEDEG